MGRFNTRKKGCLGSSLPSLPVYGQPYIFCWDSYASPVCLTKHSDSMFTRVQHNYAPMSSFNGIKCTCNNPLKPWWFTAFTQEPDTLNSCRRKLPNTFHYRWKRKSRINFHLLPGSFWFLLNPPPNIFKVYAVTLNLSFN